MDRWPPALMTREDAAAYLGVSVSIIRNMKAEGLIKSVRLRRNSRPMIRKSDLDELLENLPYTDNRPCFSKQD